MTAMGLRLFTAVASTLVLLGVALALLDGRMFKRAGQVPSEVEEQRAQWNALHLSSCTMRVTRLCECDTRPLLVTVRSGRPAAVGIETDGTVRTLGDSERAGQPLDVESLFERLRQAYLERYAKVEVSFDPTLHYPSRMYFDQSATKVDDEMTYEVNVQQYTDTAVVQRALK